jgi:hypothetical protein
MEYHVLYMECRDVWGAENMYLPGTRKNTRQTCFVFSGGRGKSLVKELFAMCQKETHSKPPLW